jgi:hypothetical protein
VKKLLRILAAIVLLAATLSTATPAVATGPDPLPCPICG